MNGDERHPRSRSPSPGLNRSNSRGSMSSMHRDQCRSSLVRRNQSMSAKQIRFYRNGDKFFGGLKLAVSQERYKEFDALLAELSSKLDLSTGAVRFIFDAENGRPITDVRDLEYGMNYVCSSKREITQIDGGYGQPHKSWCVNSKNSESKFPSGNWPRQKVNAEQGDFVKPKLVTIIKSGKRPQKKVTMLLNHKTALNLDQVLDHLSAKGTLGKVDKLCTCDFKPIRELRDLFNDDMIFIACSAQEKCRDEGFEVDFSCSNYKISPYRELKRPCGLKRATSLKHHSGGDGDLRRPARPVKRSSSVKSVGHSRNRSQSPGMRTNGHSTRGFRTKSPGSGSSGRKTPTGSIGANDELYPAKVFEKETSDSDLISDLVERTNGYGMEQEIY